MALVSKVVAAADFGGTYIGYCYMFLQENTPDLRFPEWGLNNSSKTRSCILLTPGKEFHSLGDEAERKYTELRLSGESLAWFYTENIKNILINSEDYVACQNRQTLAVVDVLAEILRFSSSHLIDRCNQELGETLVPADVFWVINLPTRAREDIVTVLKSAAGKAGISMDTLYFIPESEAIVAAVRILHKDKNIPEDVLCVCDIGGSSVEVVKLGIEKTGTIAILDSTYSNECAGQALNKCFLTFLRNVLGSHVIQAFEDYLPLQMLELMSLFELSKTNMTPEFTRKFVFGIPPALVKKFKVFSPAFRGMELFSPSSKYGDKVIMTQKSMTADESVLWPVLKDAVENVTEYLQMAFKKLNLAPSTTVIITGGFSKYWKLRDLMKRKFSRQRMFYIDTPAEAPLIGAVMVAKEMESNKAFQILPAEIQQMSGDECDVILKSLQRSQFAANEVKINVIGHVGSEPKLLIRSFVMGVKRETKKVKEDLCIFIGRRKHSVKKKDGSDSSLTTFMIPVAHHWKSLYMNGKSFSNTSHKITRLPGPSESYQAIYRSQGRKKDTIDKQRESPDLSPTPRQLGVHQDQNVEQLYPVHIREFGSEWELFQGRQSLLDWRPVYVLLYSVGLITTETVQDRENSLSSGRTSLLDFLITWIQTIYMFTARTKQGHPHIVVYGTHLNKHAETLVRSRSDIMIRQLNKYFAGTHVREWLILDPLLRGNVEDERDPGIERLRQITMDIANNRHTIELFPRNWVTFYDRLMSKKREGQKVISSNLLRKYNIQHGESLGVLELEVFLKYHVSVGNLLDFHHMDHQDYIFLDPSVISEELHVIHSIEKNSNQTKLSSYKHAAIQNSTSLQYLAREKARDQGQGTEKNQRQVLLSALLDFGLMVKPVLYDSHGNPIDPDYLIMPYSLPTMNTSSLREKLFSEKKCIAMRFRVYGYLPLAVFQRLLSSAVSLWSVMNYSAKPLLMSNLGAFSLDNYHRLILASHFNTIDVYIYHKTASRHINPSVTRNVRHFLELNLRRILCVTSLVRQTTQFVHSKEDDVIHITTKEKNETEVKVNENIYVAELATCNSFTSCFATVDELRNKEEWKCEKHTVGGESPDLLGVWYPVKENFLDPVHIGRCEATCKGLKEYLLTKAPSEQLLGRLARRLDPEIISTIAQRLGLTYSELRRVRELTLESTVWRRSFQTLHTVIHKQNLTVGQLQEAVMAEGVEKHIICQGFRIHHETGDIPEKYLERSVSRRELAAIALNIDRDIFPLAVELDISSEDILSILQRPIERDPTSTIRDVLSQWYLYSEFKPTFRVLVTALLEVGFDLVCATNAVDQSTNNDLF